MPVALNIATLIPGDVTDVGSVWAARIESGSIVWERLTLSSGISFDTVIASDTAPRPSGLTADLLRGSSIGGAGATVYSGPTIVADRVHVLVASAASNKLWALSPEGNDEVALFSPTLLAHTSRAFILGAGGCLALGTSSGSCDYELFGVNRPPKNDGDPDDPPTIVSAATGAYGDGSGTLWHGGSVSVLLVDRGADYRVVQFPGASETIVGSFSTPSAPLVVGYPAAYDSATSLGFRASDGRRVAHTLSASAVTETALDSGAGIASGASAAGDIFGLVSGFEDLSNFTGWGFPPAALAVYDVDADAGEVSTTPKYVIPRMSGGVVPDMVWTP